MARKDKKQRVIETAPNNIGTISNAFNIRWNSDRKLFIPLDKQIHGTSDI